MSRHSTWDEAPDYVDPSTVVERESQIDARQHQREERRRKAQKRAEHRKQEHIEQAYYHTGQPSGITSAAEHPAIAAGRRRTPHHQSRGQRGEPAQAADQEAAGRQAGRCDPPVGRRHDTQQHVQRPAGHWSGLYVYLFPSVCRNRMPPTAPAAPRQRHPAPRPPHHRGRHPPVAQSPLPSRWRWSSRSSWRPR